MKIYKQEIFLTNLKKKKKKKKILKKKKKKKKKRIYSGYGCVQLL